MYLGEKQASALLNIFGQRLSVSELVWSERLEALLSSIEGSAAAHCIINEEHERYVMPSRA